MEKPLVILLGAALGFFILSFAAMGFAPWTTLKRLLNPPEGFKNPYLSEDGTLNAAGRGRQTYIKEGCWHCHSQFVRPAANEPLRYGPPSQGWESMFDIPQTFGTRRIGPDLARESGRRTDDWHLSHLYNPRTVVPLSVMPSYPWLFEENDGVITPKPAALDLVAYMQTLGKPFSEKVKQIVNPPRIRIAQKTPSDDYAAEDYGKTLFGDHCQGCHGTRADGNSLANQILSPKAVDLTSRYMPAAEAYAVLFSGIPGTAMPSFNEMTDRDLWAISKYVQSLGRNILLDTQNIKTASTPHERGKTVYDEQCAACHGVDGTPLEAIASSMVPPPREFRYRLFEKNFVKEVLNTGRPGTAMPTFQHLDEQTKLDVAEYLSTFFKEPEP
jgi:cbb3-type cytochrome c oxidase subunit II